MPRTKTSKKKEDMYPKDNLKEASSTMVLCVRCGKPASILSNNKHWFCDLSCQTNYGD